MSQVLKYPVFPLDLLAGNPYDRQPYRCFLHSKVNVKLAVKTEYCILYPLCDLTSPLPSKPKGLLCWPSELTQPFCPWVNSNVAVIAVK